MHITKNYSNTVSALNQPHTSSRETDQIEVFSSFFLQMFLLTHRTNKERKEAIQTSIYKGQKITSDSREDDRYLSANQQTRFGFKLERDGERL